MKKLLCFFTLLFLFIALGITTKTFAQTLFSSTNRVTIAEGGSKTITLTYTKRVGTVYFESKNENVADADWKGDWKGNNQKLKIIAKKVGTTRIVVTNSRNSEKVKIEVVVKPKGTVISSGSGSKLKIGFKPKLLIIGKKKNRFINVYYRGKNVTDYCYFDARRVKGNKRKVKLGGMDIDDYYVVSIKGKKMGKEKIKFKIQFSPCYYDEMNLINRDAEFRNSPDGYINHPVFGRISKAEYYREYRKTNTSTFRVTRYSRLRAVVKLEFYYYGDNDFLVQVKNKSKSTITVLKNAKVEDEDYGSFSRKLVSETKKNIKIKPGKKKDLWFKVVGKRVTHGEKDKVITMKWKYRGKTYKIEAYNVKYTVKK